jgi:imidazolonepropionase-like amidohydrolase
MRWLPLCFAALAAGGAALPVPSNGQPQTDEPPIVFRGARIHTAASEPIENGVLIVHRGKIVDVGPASAVQAPAGAVVRDVGGKVIIPGLVDTHSHIGIYPRPQVPAHSDGNEGSGPVQPALRALDSIFPADPGIRMAVAGGVTTANIMPGSGNAIGGQTVYVKLRGRTVEEMQITGTKVLGGLKMANGENPKNFNFTRNKMPPATRMKLAALQREQFVKAREYQQKWAAYRRAKDAGKDAAPPETDLALEPLVEVLERRRTVHFHCHRADDIMTALRIADEFGFEIVLQHGSEAYLILDEIKKRKVPVSLTVVDSPGGKLETAGRLEENARILHEAGIKVCVNTDDWITESRFYLRTVAVTVRGGLPEEAALRAVTRNAAEVLHLDDRLGTLEKGKDADFVLLSGPPFSTYSQVLETYIDGVRVFDRSKQRDWAYQAGGFALPDPGQLPPMSAAPKPQPAVKAPAPPKGAPAWKGTPARYAVLAGRIHTAKGTITNGVIVVNKGVIEAVAADNALPFPLPADLPVLTAAVVTPGLIDAHTVVPLTGRLNVPADQDMDELSDPNQADLRVLDAFNPNEPLLEFLRAQGVTVIHAVPGRQNVIAGQTGIFRTHGRTVEQTAVRFPAALLVNLGEVPKAAYPNRQPTTRMATASLVRNALTAARNNAARRAAAKEDESKRPPRNLKLEALELALERKLPVVFSAHRADDLNTALRIAQEFNLRALLDLATEGYLTADTIAAAKVPVVVHPTMQRVGSMETFNSQLNNAAVLADRKVPIALGTGFEGYVPKTRVVRHEAAMAMANGLGFDRALAAITLDAAKLLGIDDRYGSIEPGKAADLVLYDGDPFEHATHVTHTIMDGRVVFDRAEFLKIPFERRALLAGAGSGEEGCCLGW